MTNNGVSWSELVPLAFFAGFFLLIEWRRARVELTRTEEWQEFSQRHGFAFLDDNLPYDLPQQLFDALSPDLTIRLCVAGVHAGSQFASFQYLWRFGRSRRWVAAVAIRKSNPLNHPSVNHWKIAARYEDWTLLDCTALFFPRIPPDKLLALLETQRESASHLATAPPAAPVQKGEVFIKPRHKLPLKRDSF